MHCLSRHLDGILDSTILRFVKHFAGVHLNPAGAVVLKSLIPNGSGSVLRSSNKTHRSLSDEVQTVFCRNLSVPSLIPAIHQSVGNGINPRLQGVVGHIIRDDAQLPQPSSVRKSSARFIRSSPMQLYPLTVLCAHTPSWFASEEAITGVEELGDSARLRTSHNRLLSIWRFHLTQPCKRTGTGKTIIYYEPQ